MATYDSLTAEQKADLAILEKAIRGGVSSLFAVRLNMIQLADWAEANVTPVLNTLDDAEIIPNTSGLAGAKDVTAGEFKAARAKLKSYLADAEDPTLKPVLLKLAGINAE